MSLSAEKMTELVDALSGLTVLEVSDLVRQLEAEWGVSAAAPVAVAAGPGQAAAGPAPEPEKDEFTVVLSSVGDKKIQVIKVVREITALGLKEAKDLVDGAPRNVKEGVSRKEADEIKKKLEESGAQVEIK